MSLEDLLLPISEEKWLESVAEAAECPSISPIAFMKTVGAGARVILAHRASASPSSEPIELRETISSLCDELQDYFVGAGPVTIMHLVGQARALLAGAEEKS